VAGMTERAAAHSLSAGRLDWRFIISTGSMFHDAGRTRVTSPVCKRRTMPEKPKGIW